MTTVDVFWVARDPGFITRRYADCGLLNAMFEREPGTWIPRDPIVFEHHDVRSYFPHHDGAVVAFSGMANAPDADWLIGEIDRMRWALVLILGNEQWDFPWHRLPETARRKVWVMNPLPEHAHLSNRLPGGPYPGTHAEMAPYAHLATERPLDWFFAGQVTHQRRFDCVDALAGLKRGLLYRTTGFMQGMPPEEYSRNVVSAKVVPCPSGPMTLDANRPLSALEGGAVPILDMIKPTDPQFDYWALVFGDDYPLPVIYDWNELPYQIEHLTADWRHLSNRTFSWWQQWKRRTALQLDSDIRTLAQEPAISWSEEDEMTVVITSSPIEAHPSTEILEQVIASVRERLPNVEIIIAMDGVRPEQEHLRANYDEYVRRVCWKANYEWHRTLPVVLPAWGHQANTARAALVFVRTPTILFLEHDTPIVGSIDWQGMVLAVRYDKANVIRLHQDVSIHPDHESTFAADDVEYLNDLPLRRSAVWWQRPHLAATQFYRDTLDLFFPPASRTMIEDRLYGDVWIDCLEGRWDRWKIWVYIPEGDDIRRSGHLDGRGDAPKFDMDFGE